MATQETLPPLLWLAYDHYGQVAKFDFQTIVSYRSIVFPSREPEALVYHCLVVRDEGDVWWTAQVIGYEPNRLIAYWDRRTRFFSSSKSAKAWARREVIRSHEVQRSKR